MVRKLIILIVISLFPLTAVAQTAPVTPVHGWLIGPATQGSNSSDACLLFNSFSDGSGLRFNIRNEKVEMITVIFREDIFEPGLSNTYKTILQTSGTYRLVLDGYAYGRNTLTITPPDTEEFFGELKRNTRLTIVAPRAQKTFSLRDIAKNLEFTNSCAFSEPEPQVALDPTKEIHIYADLSLPKRGQVINDVIWRAKRGERMSVIIDRWSQESGKNLSWLDASNPVLTKDFVYEGTVDNALEQLFEILQ